MRLINRRDDIAAANADAQVGYALVRSVLGLGTVYLGGRALGDSSTPAGWYPAPHANNELRYWDGAGWLDWTPQQAADAQAAGGSTPASDVAAASYPGAATAGVEGPRVAGPPRARALSIVALGLGIGALLLSWVPWLGVLLAVAAVAVGIVALVRKQPLGLSLTGLILGGLALLVALVVTISFTAFIGSSSQSDGRPVPQVTTTPENPEPQPTAEVAEPEVEPELVVPDLATFGTVDERTFALIAKEPDAHIGTNLIVFGDVAQLDSATGPCNMLLSAAEAQQENSFDYEQNTFATSGDGDAVCPVFDPLVEGDHVKMWVTVLGSFSYDTQIGGNTTVPAFQVWQAELLPAQEY